MLRIAIFASIVCAAFAKRETKRFIAVMDGKQIVQDFVTDDEANTLLITVGDVSEYKDYKSTINLHDFNTEWLAMKDVNGGACYLKPIPAETDDHKAMLEETTLVKGTDMIFKHKTMYWNVLRGQLSPEEIVELAGPRIAGFCNSYKTFRLEQKPKLFSDLQKDKGKIIGTITYIDHRRSKRRCFVCVFCFNMIDFYETDDVDIGSAIKY